MSQYLFARETDTKMLSKSAYTVYKVFSFLHFKNVTRLILRQNQNELGDHNWVPNYIKHILKVTPV